MEQLLVLNLQVELRKLEELVPQLAQWRSPEQARLQSLVPSRLVLVPDRVQLARQELSPQAGHQRMEELVQEQAL